MVNLYPHDPRDDLPDRELAKRARPQYRDPKEPTWETYIIGGVAAVLILAGIVWAASTDTPNQQSAENQPQVQTPTVTKQPGVAPSPAPANP